MKLLPYGPNDFWLIEAMETDAEVMKNLGGAMPKEKMPAIHERRLKHVGRGDWYFTIHPEGGGGPVGTIGIWDSQWKGETVGETGWMLLPAHQGRGLAGAAARLLFSRARADGIWDSVHAFPGTTNAASNAMCRTNGFTLLEECDLEYAGRPLRCNHWMLTLRDRA
jgi:RimJ/RimL family protein N-acetyltransferase